MAYIGNVPAEKYIALTQQTFSSPTGTSFTLSQAVTNSVDIDLYIDNVKQDPASYSVSGTALTTSTIASPSTMYCIYNGKAMQTVNPPDDSVGLSQIASGTDGNLITFDASGNPAYVATGSDGQVLTSAGAGAPPAFEAAYSLSVFVGNLTRAQATATGNVAYTGVGFRPKAVIFVAGGPTDQASWGFDNAVQNPGTIYTKQSSINFEADASPSSIFPREGTAWTMAVIDSLDADGFTLTWTTSGSPTAATIYVKYLAIG
jgi:hypothetical protein